MSLQTTEQILHDKVNLGRLVRRLEKSVTEEEWENGVRQDTWIKAQGTLQASHSLWRRVPTDGFLAILQKLKYARKLLKNVELYDADPTP